MPRSALTNSRRSFSRANATISPASSVCAIPNSRMKMSRISSLVLWITGATMWLGGSSFNWMMYSPRSVSTTRIPAASTAWLRPISSVSMLLPLEINCAPCRWMISSACRLASSASAAHSTLKPLALRLASACSSSSGRSRRARRLASFACWRSASPCS